MKNERIWSLFLLLITLSFSVYALSGSYMYVGLGYGRGWWPWVCVTEKGEAAVCGCPGNNPLGNYGPDDCEMQRCITNFCNAPECTVFEAAAMFGQHNCVGVSWSDLLDMRSGKKVDPSKMGNFKEASAVNNYGALSRITIPEDLKLVTKDGSVVGDELCAGDLFSFGKGVNKGEYYDDGGNMDTPPIYWVDNVEDVVNKIMDYHRSRTLTASEVTSSPMPQDGFVDPLTSIPVYNTAYITGRMICSVSNTMTYVQGTVKEGDYYKVTGKGDILFNAIMPVECMYYYYGGEGSIITADDLTSGKTDSMLDMGSPMTGKNPYLTLKLPQVIKKGPDATLVDSTAQNVLYNSVEDFFRVGSIAINKKIKVVSASNAQIVVTVSGMDEIKPGASNDLRVLVKNAGDADVEIKKISASVSNKFVLCDSAMIKPNEEAECLITVTPQIGQGLKVDVDYEYKSCGRTKTGSVSKVLIESTAVAPAASAQIYSIDVHGDCENSYYGCYAPDKDGKFAAGYKCYNTGDQYYSPVKERFNLRFVLPDLTSKTVLGASLNLFATNVNRAQEVRVFSGKVDWTPTSCSASGDICSQPYCEQCAPSFDFAGGVQRSAQTISGGKVSFDLSDQVKEAYSGGLSTLSLQLRGEEDVWASAGKDSCGRKDDWVKQDVEFAGSVGSKPYLEIVYK